MKTRMFHVLSGDIEAPAIGVVSGQVDGLVMGAMKIGTLNEEDLEQSQAFGESVTDINFYPLLVHLTVTGDSGVVAVPSISIGTNSPAYDNVLSATALSGLTLTGKQSIYLPKMGGDVAMYGTDIYANVTNIAVGAQLAIAISILGVFQEQTDLGFSTLAPAQ